MSDLLKHKKFHDIGENQQEAKNFQGYLFSNIDFRNREVPISFFRSDFRSSKFSHFHLFMNNFDRADFFDSYLSDGSIEQCQFGSDFLNTMFNKILIKENSFNSCSIINCSFIDCTFIGGAIKDISMRECTFQDCILDNVHFEMNTVDEITFKDCCFKNIDFSNMTAINISYVNCSFESFSIDPDYLGSYFVIGDFFGKTSFKYRGHSLKLFSEQKELIEGFISLYQESNRYYELMNLYLLMSTLNDSQNSDMFTIIPKLFMEKNQLVKDYHLRKILDILKFYLNSPKINFITYFLLISVLEKHIRDEKDIGYILLISSKINYLKVLVEDKVLKRENLNDEFFDRIILLELELSISDFDLARKLINEYFNCFVSKERNLHNSVRSFYKIIDVRPGSVIVEVLCYAFLTVPLSIIFKKTLGNIVDAVFEYKFKKVGMKLLKNSKNTRELKKIKTIFFDSNTTRAIVSKDNKKEDLLDVLKSLKVFVNTFN